MRKIDVIKYILLLFLLIYIFYPTKEDKIEKMLSNEKTIINNIFINKNISYEDLSTFKNSGFIDIQNNNILLATPLKKSEQIIKNLMNLLNTINNVSCVNYNKNSFSISETSKKILKENKNYFIQLMGSGINNIDIGNIYKIDGDVLLTNNNENKIISNIEAQRYFGNIDDNNLPQYYLSKIPYPAGYGIFFGYKFKIYSYALVKIDSVKYKNDIKEFSGSGSRLIFTINKVKKRGNGLIIDKFNNNQFNDLKILLKKEDLSIDDISIENENFNFKNEIYGSKGYYKNINSYISLLRDFSLKNNKKFNIFKISDNKYIFETEDEYIGIIFDDNGMLEKSKMDIKEKISLLKKSYNISNIIYFIDKNLFQKVNTNIIDKNNCSFGIKNGSIVLLK